MKYEKESYGISATFALQLIFLVLKLAHLVNWKWVWVLAPTWISVIISCAIVFVVAIVMIIKSYKEKARLDIIRKQRERR